MENKTQIQAQVRKTKNGYIGFITVREKTRYLWSESTGMTRITYDDALNDAKIREYELMAATTGSIL